MVEEYMQSGLDLDFLYSKDLTILYQGGSGGFFFYYLMLLSDNFTSGEEYNLSVEEKIKKQFSMDLVNNRSNWKSVEYWPNNNILKSTVTDKRKLFLICNPLFSPSLLIDHMSIIKDSLCILFYTSLDVQLRMAYEKNAYWFTDVSKRKFNAPKSTLQYIKQIKKDFYILKNTPVDSDIKLILKIFNPLPINLIDALSYDRFNQNQKNFIEYWTSLQSNKIKRMIIK